MGRMKGREEARNVPFDKLRVNRFHHTLRQAQGERLFAWDGFSLLTDGEGLPFVLSLSEHVMAVRAEPVEARK
jgi:hypothetical protein